jgi:hypothetical protein
VSDSLKYPWETGPTSPLPTIETPAAKAKPRGRRPAAAHRVAAGARAADWLYQHLTISGPAASVTGFAAAARGSGVIPWQLDFADVEETVFTLAVSQPAGRRNLSIEGCRILAQQFREKVEARQARAMALVGNSQACPFDLQTLLPVPDTVLALGPTHPAALDWLAAHWGTTERLRQVSVRDKPGPGRRLPHGHAVIGYGFFTQGETPAAAIAAITAQWPALAFRLVPRPAD